MTSKNSYKVSIFVRPRCGNQTSRKTSKKKSRKTSSKKYCKMVCKPSSKKSRKTSKKKSRSNFGMKKAIIVDRKKYSPPEYNGLKVSDKSLLSKRIKLQELGNEKNKLWKIDIFSHKRMAELDKQINQLRGEIELLTENKDEIDYDFKVEPSFAQTLQRLKEQRKEQRRSAKNEKRKKSSHKKRVEKELDFVYLDDSDFNNRKSSSSETD